jgi:LysM repeat protein
MIFPPGLLRSLALLALTVLLLSACAPSSTGPSDEEKEPLFLAGKERVTTLDYKGAIESFEKALQVNPRSAAAHFELATLFDTREDDPAAAIYHYQQFLLLRPGAQKAYLARARILMCKQALAQTVMLGPLTDKVQRQLEQVLEENKQLKEEKKQLQEENEKWSAYAARLQIVTNQAPAPAVSARTLPVGSMAQSANSARVKTASPVSTSQAVTSVSSRTHTVKSGDTPSLIARKYGVRLDALMAANPSLDPHRLRVGQRLRIPSS